MINMINTFIIYLFTANKCQQQDNDFNFKMELHTVK